MRIISTFKMLYQGLIYLIWNTEQRLPELYKSQKLKPVWKGLPG